MTIRTEKLIEMLSFFPSDAAVRGFEDGLSVKNSDGAGEVLILNDIVVSESTIESDARHPAPRKPRVVGRNRAK